MSFLRGRRDRRDEALEKTREFFRLFMAPSGSGSNGPDTFDSLPYLERWVERGIPPKSILAAHKTSGVVDRTRPLCPYPEVAVYKGSGNTDEAANFVCRDPRDRASRRRTLISRAAKRRPGILDITRLGEAYYG